MKKRFSKLIEKDGFYIILFVCVCVVAVTAVLASKKNLTKSNEDNLSEFKDFTVSHKEEPYLEISRMKDCDLIVKEDNNEEKNAEETEEDIEDDGEKDDEEIEQPEEKIDEVIDETKEEPVYIKTVEESKGEMMLPVEGKIGADFTTDNLIYSETLEEWTSHKGMDILASEGTEVKAAMSGKITEVYKDDLWGIVILIDHGNGLMTKYANLFTGEMIKEGTQVNKGDVISKVGKTASIEMMMEPHVHFEVIKDGICIDPKSCLPVFNTSN